MAKVLVSGLLNIETVIQIDSFPVEYCPIEYPFFGVHSAVSGVCYNVAKALKTLGDEPHVVSVLGDDMPARRILKTLEKDGIEAGHAAVFEGKLTAESAVLTDKEGKRKIYCDLKDLQDRAPLEGKDIAWETYDLAVITNINFNRLLLKEAKAHQVPIATDVHILSSIDDPYNKDFMENADILFFSNEAVMGREGDLMMDLFRRYHNPIIVCGCGAEGALLYLGRKNRFVYEPAVAPKGIVSTLGAGDALFSAFIHFYSKGQEPEICLKKAVRFAGIKISVPGGAKGFVKEEELGE